jgi:Na+/H+-dicarboxylate symporter
MKNPWSDPARILVALVLGVAVGALVPASAGIGTLTTGAVFAFLGDLFLRLLQMVVVPLVATSIITSVARLGRDHAFARLGTKTAAYYVSTTVLASIVGVIIFNAVQPGKVSPEVSAQLRAGVPASVDEVSKGLDGKSTGDLAEA